MFHHGLTVLSSKLIFGRFEVDLEATEFNCRRMEWKQRNAKGKHYENRNKFLAGCDGAKKNRNIFFRIIFWHLVQHCQVVVWNAFYSNQQSLFYCISFILFISFSPYFINGKIIKTYSVFVASIIWCIPFWEVRNDRSEFPAVFPLLAEALQYIIPFLKKITKIKWEIFK